MTRAGFPAGPGSLVPMLAHRDFREGATDLVIATTGPGSLYPADWITTSSPNPARTPLGEVKPIPGGSTPRVYARSVPARITGDPANASAAHTCAVCLSPRVWVLTVP